MSGPADDSLTVADAANKYLSGLHPSSENQADVLRFVRWFESERTVRSLSGHDVATWVESISSGNPLAERRVDSVRNFLLFLKKQGLVDTNLASHVRFRRSGGRSGASQSAKSAAQERKEVTVEGHASLLAELEALKAERPEVARELGSAMADKDFRENAPLDAARDRQGHLEARIRQIEETLRNTEIVGKGGGNIVHLGSTVTLTHAQSGANRSYTIVSPNEVNPSQGKISPDSPVGKAALGRRVGDEIEVSTPSGMIRYRIEKVLG